MLLATALLTNLLLASAVLGAPTVNNSPIVRRQRGYQSLRSLNATNIAARHVYDSNWSGAVLQEPTKANLKTVTAEVVVPNLTKPAGSDPGTSSVAAWVGIDGDSCSVALFQAGIQINVDDNGNFYGSGWYEWVPEGAHLFDTDISVGDRIRMTITAYNPLNGLVTIENLTTGVKHEASVASDYALCRQNADWIVEDFSRLNAQVPFADFGTITFEAASATKVIGEAEGPQNAGIIDIYDGAHILTSSSVDSSSVTVQYVG